MALVSFPFHITTARTFQALQLPTVINIIYAPGV